jgi:hypothetical protein
VPVLPKNAWVHLDGEHFGSGLPVGKGRGRAPPMLRTLIIAHRSRPAKHEQKPIIG